MAVEDVDHAIEEKGATQAPEKSESDNDQDDDDLMDVMPAKDLNWGLQAIVGETKMFPDEEDGNSAAVSPMNGVERDQSPLTELDDDLSHPKRTGLYRPKCINTNTVDDPAEPTEEKLWSPTIAHMILQGCDKSDPTKSVKEAMTDAFRCMVDGTPESKAKQKSQNDSRLWDRFNRKGDQSSNPHSASYNHHYAPHQNYGGYPPQDYYQPQYLPANPAPYQATYPYKKEPCKYFAMGGRCRKPDCLYYHDTQQLNNALQAVYEDEIKKQMDYDASASILYQHDAEERQKDIDGNVSSADRTVYIVGIDSSTLDEHVLVRLSQFGSVRKYQLCGDPNQPTRYGFFEYNTQSGCNGCMSLDGKKMFTRPIRVSRAKDAIKGGRSIAEVHQQGLLRMAAICIVQGIEAPCQKGTNLCAPPPIASKILRYTTPEYEGQYYDVPQEGTEPVRKKVPVAPVVTVPEKDVEDGDKCKSDIQEDNISPSMWTKRKAPTEIAAAT